jgi:hypothetical protein
MPFLVASRRLSSTTLQKRYGEAVTIDVTSRGPQPWVRFSPFYPHGGIPVPLSPGYTSMSVEGIWQGLKVFEQADIDLSRFAITTMKGIKRTERAYGKVPGHRAGVAGEHLLDYAAARRAIYLPAYHQVLEHYLQAEGAELCQLGAKQTVVLLDYETNGDLNNLVRPLSHAALVVCYLEGNGRSRPEIPTPTYLAPVTYKLPLRSGFG